MKLTEKKRNSIVAAAIEEFQEQGFRGAKTTRIAEKAGVSSRTLYKHFESKEALFQVVSELMIKRKSVMGPVPFDPERPLDEQLIEAIDRYLEVVTNPEVMVLTRMVIAETLIDLERSKTYLADYATFQSPLRRLISEAMAAGVIRQADPDYALRQLTALIREFFYTPEFMLGQKQETDGVMADCVAMFLGHYKVG